MTTTTQETLSVDGVILNTYAKNIMTLAGRLRSAPLRTGNLTIPQRHGELRMPRKWYGANVLTLPMWVIGSDDNGNVPVASTSRIEFFKRIDELTALFGSPEVLDVRHTLPDGSVRQCFAEVLEANDFTASGISVPKALFNVALTVPGAFWQDLNAVTWSLTNPTLPSTQALTQFAGATAPMDDLTITLTGPITNPKVEAYRNSAGLTIPVYFQYNGTLASGQTMIVNCATWSLSGTAGATYANFVHAGDPRWFSLSPAPVAGTPQIRLSGTGGSAVTAISVTGRRKYLVG